MFIKRHFNAITRCITLILVLFIQLIIISGLSVWVHSNTVYTYILIEVIGILSMIPLLSGNRNSAYKIYWILVILLIVLSLSKGGFYKSDILIVSIGISIIAFL